MPRNRNESYNVFFSGLKDQDLFLVDRIKKAVLQFGGKPEFCESYCDIVDLIKALREAHEFWFFLTADSYKRLPYIWLETGVICDHNRTEAVSISIQTIEIEIPITPPDFNSTLPIALWNTNNFCSTRIYKGFFNDYQNRITTWRKMYGSNGSTDNTTIVEPTRVDSPDRSTIFISYSHEDKELFDLFKTHLRPYERKIQGLKIWDDTKISPGDNWLHEIQEALASTKIAVLLVSPNFLNSDFITNVELESFLKDQKECGLRILWLPIRYSSYKETQIAEFQSVHNPDYPLQNLSDPEKDEVLANVCEEIKKQYYD